MSPKVPSHVSVELKIAQKSAVENLNRKDGLERRKTSKNKGVSNFIRTIQNFFNFYLDHS